MKFYELEKRFGTEMQCRKYIAGLRWPTGYRCPRCQSDQAWITKEYKYKCQKCGHKASVTAGTLFQDSHIPLPIWFKVIYRISSQPLDITAKALQMEFSIGSNRTALEMLHKLKPALVSFNLDELQGNVELLTTDIRVPNKLVFVAIGVEIINRKIGRIRIETIRRGITPDIVYFIDKYVEEHSTLIHKNLILSNLRLYKDYTQVIKTERYNFSYIKRVINKLESWLYDSYTEGDLSSCLDEFCMRVNSLKSRIPFEDFMRNVVELNPLSDNKKIYGIEI